MTQSNLDLLFHDVTTHLDQLHSVEQGVRDRAETVSRSDEKDLTQVVIHIQVIIVEGLVLLRVEHFEQGRHGVTVVSGLCHFVYLVEDKDRVA